MAPVLVPPHVPEFCPYELKDNVPAVLPVALKVTVAVLVISKLPAIAIAVPIVLMPLPESVNLL